MSTEKLINILGNLQGENKPVEGTFYAKHSQIIDDLDVEIKIDDYGAVSVPLTTDEIKKLCELSRPAKFGWKDQTLLDKNIRNTSEISGNKLQVNYGRDNKEFLTIIDDMRKKLGLSEECKLNAHLHNLLIYSPGQFFAPHQDTEKLDGMVASLIVVLPSAHLGGELIIDNQGNKKSFAFENLSSREINFVSFYADCHHEVKPIKEGYRIVLTYNLVLETTKDAMVSKVDNTPLKEALKKYFTETLDSPHKQSPPRLAYLLDYNYTKHGLSWKMLKGDDRIRAYALREAAKELDYDIYLALAKVRENWTTYDDYYDRRYENTNNAAPEPDELIEQEITFSNWLDINDKLVANKDLDISDSELCWTLASNEFEPFDTEHEGWMGNYGNTIDYWYHRTAVIMWRKVDALAMRFTMQPKTVLKEFYSMTQSSDKEEELNKKLKIVSPYWDSHLSWNANKKETKYIILNIACYINNPANAKALLCQNDLMTISSNTISLFIKLHKIYGTKWCLNLLKIWKENTQMQNPYSNFLNVMTSLASGGIDKEIIDFILKYQRYVIHEIDKSDNDQGDMYLARQARARTDRIIEFFKVLDLLRGIELYNTLLKYVIANNRLYPQLELFSLLNYIESLSNKKIYNYHTLRDHISKSLTAEFEKGLRNKDDWSIPLKSNCDCQECIILNNFLASNNERKKVWPIAEAKREHISQKIFSIEAPVDRATEKKGSPYKLLLTKQNSIYIDAKKRFNKITEAYKLLALC